MVGLKFEAESNKLRLWWIYGIKDAAATSNQLLIWRLGSECGPWYPCLTRLGLVVFSNFDIHVHWYKIIISRNGATGRRFQQLEGTSRHFLRILWIIMYIDVQIEELWLITSNLRPIFISFIYDNQLVFSQPINSQHFSRVTVLTNHITAWVSLSVFGMYV